MTDTEFLILSILSRGGPTEVKIIWQVMGVENRRATEERLTCMRDKKFISRKSGLNKSLDIISLLPFGEDALDAEEKRIALEKQRLNDQRQAASNDKAEKAADRKFHLLNTLLGALAGSLFTLFVEHIII